VAETLDWTYEVAPAGADAAGLEEYVVETADGSDAGRVHVVLDHAGELYVVVDRDLSPAARELIAVPEADVVSVDNAALRVRLRARDRGDLDALPRLDRARGMERDERDGDAVAARRVEDVTGRFAPETVEAGETAVVDTYVLPLAVATGILSAFALLSAALMATGGAGSWQWLLIALFVVLALVAGALTYRAWRRPYARV
jgi:hypothetical protein